MSLRIRKTQIVVESVSEDAGAVVAPPVTRVAGLAVIHNPFAVGNVQGGQAPVPDLSQLFDMGMVLGERLAAEMVQHLPRPAVAYGKAAIVGTGGELEHAAAVLHPKLGKPFRAALGGGEAIIPSTAKVAPPGTPIDVPLAHKDETWAFDQLDTFTLFVADAPLPHEILVVLAISDGGRPHARIGQGRAVV